ncbi:glycosyltransferase family 4 protein, partial [Adlercreutzia sp. ZJ141]
GVGVDVPRDVDEGVFREKYGLGDSPYIIYAGRIEEGKGCGVLFRYFAGWKLRHPGDDLKLVLVGAAKMPVLDHPDVLYLGFVDEVDKFSGIKGALALVQPSRFESLSIVLLEALRSGTPVLVNGACKVLKGHCLRSNAGLYYANYLEFEKELEYMMTHPDVHGRMGELGVRYVDENYSWDVIMGELCSLIDRVAAR